LKQLTLALLAGFLGAFVALQFVSSPSQNTATETTFERVMRTGKVRCGYYVWPPLFDKNVNTGEYSGISHDIWQEIGKRLNLEIEWSYEIDFAHLFEGLNNNSIDAVCGYMISTPSRARGGDFTISTAWFQYFAYVREGDNRFDEKYEAINQADIKLGTLEGEMSDIIAKEDYPNAKVSAYSGLQGFGYMLDELAAGRVDVAITEPVAGIEYMRSNPGKVRKVKGSALRVSPAGFIVHRDAHNFRRMLDHTLQTLVDVGFLDKVFEKYPDYDQTIARAAPKYKAN
jgi:polar amino acid transport system substrate-binding protein